MIELKFDIYDFFEEEEALELIEEINNATKDDKAATIVEKYPAPQNFAGLAGGTIVALISVSVVSVTTITILVAFIYRIFRCGVVVDLREGNPKFHHDKTMPRGSTLIYQPGQDPLYSEGLSVKMAVDLITSALKAVGKFEIPSDDKQK